MGQWPSDYTELVLEELGEIMAGEGAVGEEDGEEGGPVGEDVAADGGEDAVELAEED